MGLVGRHPKADLLTININSLRPIDAYMRQ